MQTPQKFMKHELCSWSGNTETDPTRKKIPPSNPQSEREGTIMHSHGHTFELPFAATVLDW